MNLLVQHRQGQKVGCELRPLHVPGFAAAAFLGNPARLEVVSSVVQVAQKVSAGGLSDASDKELLARACWALALCTEVYRVGLMLGSPLRLLLRGGSFVSEEVVALAPPDALRQMAELDAVARERFYPTVGQAKRVDLGPTFACSELCAADADLIADGVLIDLKTHLGPKNPRTGVRSDSMRLLDLYQLVAYALFDTTDEFKIQAIGGYSARYGNLITWPLGESLNTMSGTSVDVAEERRTIWRLLGGAAESDQEE